MKVYVLDNVLEYENNIKTIDIMFEEINHIISDSQYTYSHMDIDGLSVYEDIYDYFSENIGKIKEVKVVTKNINEFVKEVLGTTAGYFERAIPEIEILSDEFYKTPTQKSWEGLRDLTDGIKWIMDSYVVLNKSDVIENLVRNYDVWQLYSNDMLSLKDLLKNVDDVLQNNDLISLADIFSYELVPLFKEMQDKLNLLTYRGVN